MCKQYICCFDDMASDSMLDHKKINFIVKIADDRAYVVIYSAFT